MKKLIYLPLEPYKERYTELMSSRGGWAENHFKNLGVNFIRVEGEGGTGSIHNGVVLDAIGRSKWALSQIQQVVSMIDEGLIDENCVIYTEDFWHSGIDSLFYVRALCKIDFKIGCFIHAQTFDEFDFCATPEIADWMRHIEVGYLQGYDYVFTCSQILKDKIINDVGSSLFDPKSKIHVTGLPYNVTSLVEHIKSKLTEEDILATAEKEPFVLFSSRFDREKNPHFFLDLVERCPDIQFKLVNPRSGRSLSNDETVIDRLTTKNYPNLEIVDTTDKIEYYKLLIKAKVQFNCALQDWVSWTLLEAVTFFCNPVYPCWRDFPAELEGCDAIYDNKSLDGAEHLVREALEKDFQLEKLIPVVMKHDKTWEKQLTIMQLI